MPLLTTALALLCSMAGDVAPDVRIARGLAALDALEYDDAALELTLAAADARASDAQKVRANLYAGIAHRVLNQDTEARLNFMYVLKRAPNTELPPNTAPKITAFYALVREELAIVPPAAATASPTTAPTTTTAPNNSSAVAVEPASAPNNSTAAAKTAAAAATATTASAPNNSSAVAESPTAIGPLVFAGVGGVVAVGGIVAVALGSGPYFAHESAVDGLHAAAATGADGSALQAQQIESHKEWDAWGQLTTTLGAVGVGVGVAVAGVAIVDSLYSNAP